MLSSTENIKTLRQNAQTVQRRISGLSRRIQDATITATIAGRIDEIRRVNVGDYVMEGEEILKIIPQDSDSIKAELQFDPSRLSKTVLRYEAKRLRATCGTSAENASLSALTQALRKHNTAPSVTLSAEISWPLETEKLMKANLASLRAQTDQYRATLCQTTELASDAEALAGQDHYPI